MQGPFLEKQPDNYYLDWLINPLFFSLLKILTKDSVTVAVDIYYPG